MLMRQCFAVGALSMALGELVSVTQQVEHERLHNGTDTDRLPKPWVAALTSMVCFTL
jgi:hypothetical protein